MTASWCSLGYIHGPHGVKSKEPCPGLSEARRPTKGPTMERSTRKTVLDAVMRYQRALESIGIVGAATVQWGSLANGVSHQMEFRSPDLQHPEVESIGRTYEAAERHVNAAAAAIEFTARAMKRRDARTALPTGRDQPFRQEYVIIKRAQPEPDQVPLLHDPDARGARRYPDRPDSWHPEVPL